MNLTPAQYEALYGTSGTKFPNNTTGLITEPIMREFGQNQKDSLLFQQANSVWRDCGNWNFAANSDLFPETGGTGASGQILKNNTFLISGAGTPSGVSEEIPVGATIRALSDEPGQAAGSWSVIYPSGGGGGGGTWGSITGTLSSQTDLQSALNAKLNAIPTIVDGGTNYTLQASDLALITAGATLIIEGDETGTLTIPLDATVDFPDNCIIGFRGFILVAVTGGITETHTNDSLDCEPGLEFTWSLEKRGTNTWNISNGTAGGGGGGTTYTFTASDFNESGTTISIDYTNGQAASASTKGFLTSDDYTSFAGNDLVSASVSTSGGTITLDMDSKKQKMFVGSATFSASKTMAISNSTAALTFSFSFEVTDVAATIVLPSTWLMGDVYWNSATDTWTPPATGKYLMVGSYNGTNWFITIAGPFN